MQFRKQWEASQEEEGDFVVKPKEKVQVNPKFDLKNLFE